MNPREIEVHIEELVLHGFEAGSRWQIADAIEAQLRGLLVERGVPAAWRENPASLNAGSICLTSPAATGGEIAAAIHRGGAR